MSKKIVILILALVCVKTMQAQYISEVLEYKPAPGQFINSSPWGIPNSAKSLIGGVTGSMSLGAFGGYVVFKFANPVENDPDNPYGVDFTIYGNPLDEWSEQGIVSVMQDENGNGLPDDTWYELAGSDYAELTRSPLPAGLNTAAGTWHNVIAVLAGNKMAYFVDGTQVVSVIDDNVTQGGIATYGGWGSAVRVDNLRIWDVSDLSSTD